MAYIECELQVEKEEATKIITNALNNGKSWDELAGILEEDWSEEVYHCTKIGGTDISLLSKEEAIAVIADPKKW